eukprot:2874366-Rhodomonas_salina.1
MGSSFAAGLCSETVAADTGMDRSPNSVFTKTLNGIKVQIALDALRGETQDFEEFRSNVNQLFPTRKKMNAEEARIVDKIRADLLTVTRSSQ